MDRKTKRIFIFFVSYLFCLSFGFASEGAITPVREQNTLDNIEINYFIPEIILHSAEHDFSVFEAYLNSHGIKVPLSGDLLEWTVAIRSRSRPPTLIDEDTIGLEEEISPTSLKVIPSHDMESEVIETVLFSKNFLLDVISSLQKHKDYQEVHAIFHPGNRISLEMLQTKLSNSLEFKVLSHQSNNSSAGKIASNLSGKNLSLPLCESVIQKQRALLIPNVRGCKVLLTSLENPKLIKSEPRDASKYQKQSTSNILAPGLGFPSIIPRTNIAYIYHPNMQWKEIVVLNSKLSK